MSIQSDFHQGAFHGKRSLFATAAILAVVACASPAAALAADADQAGPSGGQAAAAGDQTNLQEIVVTARRVEENIQKVPVTVNAIPAARLQQLQISNAFDLQMITPGVQACCSIWNNTTLTVVRGIQNGAPTYFADVPNSPQGYGNFLDISSVQVLKGPQGTLFGQASVAGAFVYQPVKPGTTFGGYVSAMVGDYNKRELEGAVDLPLMNGRVLVRLTGLTDGRDGYVQDLSSNRYYGNENYYILRPQVTIHITDKLENYTLFQYSHATTNGQSSGMWVLEDFNFNTTQYSQSALLAQLNGGTQAAFAALKDQMLALQLKLGPYKVAGLDTGCQASGTPPPATISTIKATGIPCPSDLHEDALLVNSTSYRFNDTWSIKNTIGLEMPHDYNSPLDLSMSPLILNNSGSWRNTSAVPTFVSLSDELQLFGKIGMFDINVGTFHIRRDVNQGILYATSLSTNDTATKNVTRSISHAVYAQTNIHPTDKLTFTFGGRFTQDLIAQTNYGYDPVTLKLTSTLGGPTSPIGAAQFETFSYTAGVQYQFTPQTMFFFTNSRGYNAGGFNATPVVGFGAFQPAELTNFEGGVKSTFHVGNVRIRADVSGFYGLFNNVQVTALQPSTNAITGQFGLNNITVNAAKAIIQGFEGEFDVTPFSGLNVGSTVAYTDDRYTKWPSIDSITLKPVDLSDTRFTRAPKWKIDFHGSYTLPFIPESAGRVSVNGDWVWQSLLASQLVPETPTNPAIPNTGLLCYRTRTVANGYPVDVADGGRAWIDCKPPFSNLDIGAQWKGALGHENLTLVFTVTNVTGNIWANSASDLERGQGFVGAQSAEPRMFSVRARYAF